MSWIERIAGGSRLLKEGARRKSVPEGLWTKCEACDAVLYRAALERTLEVCPTCGHHRSIGSVVGEKFVAGVNASIEHCIPLVCLAASGGARMQESLFSLMQMAKTSAALAKLSERGLPFISVLTHPTMGGVSASFAMLGDVQIAEPKALIGFAGPRVIEQTVRQKLPEGFQRAEFLLDKGAVDLIVDRREMRERVHRILATLTHFAPGVAH